MSITVKRGCTSQTQTLLKRMGLTFTTPWRRQARRSLQFIAMEPTTIREGYLVKKVRVGVLSCGTIALLYFRVCEIFCKMCQYYWILVILLTIKTEETDSSQSTDVMRLCLFIFFAHDIAPFLRTERETSSFFSKNKTQLVQHLTHIVHSSFLTLRFFGLNSFKGFNVDFFETAFFLFLWKAGIICESGSSNWKYSIVILTTTYES